MSSLSTDRDSIEIRLQGEALPSTIVVALGGFAALVILWAVLSPPPGRYIWLAGGVLVIALSLVWRVFYFRNTALGADHSRVWRTNFLGATSSVDRSTIARVVLRTYVGQSVPKLIIGIVGPNGNVVIREGGSAWAAADLRQFADAIGAPLDGDFTTISTSLIELDDLYPGIVAPIARRPTLWGAGLALAITAAIVLGVALFRLPGVGR